MKITYCLENLYQLSLYQIIFFHDYFEKNWEYFMNDPISVTTRFKFIPEIRKPLKSWKLVFKKKTQKSM